MPVAAGVVRDLRMAARRVLAAGDISAERRRATALDRTHHLQLVEAHMPAVGVTPSRTVIAENVRDLQSWSSHSRATASPAPRCLAWHACGPVEPAAGVSAEPASLPPPDSTGAIAISTPAGWPTPLDETAGFAPDIERSFTLENCSGRPAM